MAFNAANKMPDVYIDEIQLPGPIAGVGTSTAAFIGPALGGDPNKPTLITNWSQFLNKFGPDLSDLSPIDPERTNPNRAYINTPPVFVTHAVRGFFDNGGSACYFVRTSKAAKASASLLDLTGNASALVVSARKEGSGGNDISVTVKNESVASGLAPAKDAVGVTSVAGTKVVLDAAPADMMPGDIVLFVDNNVTETAAVENISGTTLTLKAPLTKAFSGNATVRIANLAPPLDKLRLKSITGVEPGTYLRISQVQGPNTVSETAVVKSVNATANQVVLSQPLTNTYLMDANDPDIKIDSQEFTLTIIPKNGTAETYSKLSMDPRHSRYFRTIIESASPSSIVEVTRGTSTSGPPDDMPVEVAAPGTALLNGQNENIGQLIDNDYINALATLEAIDDVNMICIPDMAIQSVQSALITHCENMQDRFAILDPAKGAGASNGILTQRTNLGSARGFGALYFPRIYISNPFGGDPLLVPPSGHVAGVFARTDDSRGVHKAPANEQVRGALSLEATLTVAEMGRLNEQSVNVLRPISGAGIRVWGARTISTSTQWRYVNVRRLLLFLEESIQEGTQFAIFEPNDLKLRAQVKRQVTDFLTRIWRDGALFGATPEAAFRVRVDEELNPPDVRALGQLIIEVVVVPTTPAEFIVFRIVSDPTGNVLLEQ